MGPQDVIASVLGGDSIDGPNASSWVASYPSKFGSQSDVPAWMTTSIKTMLSLPVGDSLARHIIALPGLANTTQTADIEINLLSYNSAEKSDGWHADVAGGETALIRILIRQPRTAISSTPALIENLSNRVMFILDSSMRNMRGGMLTPIKTLPAGEGASLTVPFGTGVDPDFPMFCYFLGCNDQQTGIEWTINFRAEYVRLFGTPTPN